MRRISMLQLLQEMPMSIGEQRVSSFSQESFYNLVHDLRQPLSAIESLAFCLELVVPPEHEQAQHYISRLRQLVAEASATLAVAVSESRQPQ